jgi:hypothetical protein
VEFDALVTVENEPEPVVERAKPNAVAVGVVEEIAAVPGTADFDVANEVAGADVMRAPTIIESPTA